MEHYTENQLQPKRKKLLQIATVVFLAASLVYLAYRLITFEQYDSLLQLFRTNTTERNFWLIGVLLLLPLNLLTEALKWKMMTRKIENISIITALKSVLAGAATGFITPNRIGDILGKISMLKPENRNTAPGLAITGSITQNLAIILPGIPALMLFLHDAGTLSGISGRSMLIFYSIIATLLLLILPVFIAWLRKTTHEKLPHWLSVLKTCQITDLLPLLFISIIRYGISCVQLWMFLMYTGIELSLFHAFSGIASTYLFATFTPSFAVSEGIIRASFALLFIGHFAGNHPAIAIAAPGLWIINIILPVITGNIILLRKRSI